MSEKSQPVASEDSHQGWTKVTSKTESKTSSTASSRRTSVSSTGSRASNKKSSQKINVAVRKLSSKAFKILSKVFREYATQQDEVDKNGFFIAFSQEREEKFRDEPTRDRKRKYRYAMTDFDLVHFLSFVTTGSAQRNNTRLHQRAAELGVYDIFYCFASESDAQNGQALTLSGFLKFYRLLALRFPAVCRAHMSVMARHSGSNNDFCNESTHILQTKNVSMWKGQFRRQKAEFKDACDTLYWCDELPTVQYPDAQTASAQQATSSVVIVKSSETKTARPTHQPEVWGRVTRQVTVRAMTKRAPRVEENVDVKSVETAVTSGDLSSLNELLRSLDKITHVCSTEQLTDDERASYSDMLESIALSLKQPQSLQKHNLTIQTADMSQSMFAAA